MTELLHLIWQYAIPFVLVLSIVVFVHEFGHYWVAKKCGVKIDSFSIGFGPELFGWTDRSGTRWRFSLLPLGGYVKMFGDADPASNPDKTAMAGMSAGDRQQAFFAKTVEQRFAIVFAGPAINFIFAILVLTGLFAAYGQPFSPPVVGQILENSAAAAAGLQLDDRIIQIDQKKIERFEDIQQYIAINRGEPIEITLLRAGQEMRLPLTPKITEVTDRFGNKGNVARIGIARSGIEFRNLPPQHAFVEALRESWTLSVSTLKAMGQIIMGTRGTEELGGPLRIAQMSGEMTHSGFRSFLWFLAVLSLNLGLLNLFPIPLLDGGHLVYYIAEKIRGKPLGEAWQEWGARVGMALVLSLMVFATWNDIVQLRIFENLIQLFS